MDEFIFSPFGWVLMICRIDAFSSSVYDHMPLSLVVLAVLTAGVVLLLLYLNKANARGERAGAESPGIQAVELGKKTLSAAEGHLSESRAFQCSPQSLSVRVNEAFMLIACRSVEGTRLSPEEARLVAINDGSGRRDPEIELHANIYKSRREMNAAAVIQSPAIATASQTGRDIPPILDDMAQIIGPSLRVAKLSAYPPGETIKVVLKAARGRNGLLLANQGAVCLGRDMPEALTACEIMEKACRVYAGAGHLGGGIAINSLEARLMHLFYLKKYSKRKYEKNTAESKPGETPVDSGGAVPPPAGEVIVSSGKRLLESGLVSGTWGNISLRLDENHMAITPSGRDYETLAQDEIVAVNINDLSFSGRLKPSSEKALHAEIYRSRRDVGAIIHTHSPNACAVAAARTEIPAVSQATEVLGPSIRIADYALPSTKKLVRRTLKALEGRNAALLANHGAVCAGRDMEEAFYACEELERACGSFIASSHQSGRHLLD